MMLPNDFSSLVRISLAWQRMNAAAAQTIVSRMGLLARGTLSPAEAMSMWVEKPVAFTRGWQGAAMAFAHGRGVSAIIEAGLAPVAARAGSNARRLNRPRRR
ncbi:hypothetical protein [Pontivivens ytuae]|uniref:Antifreeze protein n=1 Tax=Pontivivens ytuae TaxID=2789856 RepID=A0A7S9QCD2_9RHOB|nr:hypothetical protein [Pontivivens ytuae]QPH53705.1 hypothetical protein I0K15_18295 [Pontivivens ytuae]